MEKIRNLSEKAEKEKEIGNKKLKESEEKN